MNTYHLTCIIQHIKHNIEHIRYDMITQNKPYDKQDSQGKGKIFGHFEWQYICCYIKTFIYLGFF